MPSENRQRTSLQSVFSQYDIEASVDSLWNRPRMQVMEVAEMSFNQTRDLLDHARDFHRRLIHFYKGILPHAADEITGKLIEDLIDHELQMESRLTDYEENGPDNTLDTFFKYMLATTDQLFSSYPIPDQVDTEYVINATRYFDNKLCRFYEGMAGKAMSVEVQDVLGNLQHLEQREQMVLSKLMLSLQTI
jgi:rubrerythrin